jgi:hypothetical protein
MAPWGPRDRRGLPDPPGPLDLRGRRVLPACPDRRVLRVLRDHGARPERAATGHSLWPAGEEPT